MFLLQWMVFFFVAHAQTPYVGGHIGVSDASGPITPKELEFSFGGRGGWVFYDHVGVGAFVQYYQADQATVKTAYLPFLAEVTYFPFYSPFEGRNTLHLSAMFGATQMYISDPTGKRNEAETTFGWSAGYSLFIDPQYFVGPEIQYFYVLGSDNFTFWNAQVALKVFF